MRLQSELEEDHTEEIAARDEEIEQLKDMLSALANDPVSRVRMFLARLTRDAQSRPLSLSRIRVSSGHKSGFDACWSVQKSTDAEGSTGRVANGHSGGHSTSAAPAVGAPAVERSIFESFRPKLLMLGAVVQAAAMIEYGPSCSASLRRMRLWSSSWMY